jgi:DnaJ-domain-containing protein 1
MIERWRSLQFAKAMYLTTRGFAVRSNFDSTKNYYAILGVEPGATDSQIKAAYLRCVKTQHPDVTHGTAELEA